MSLYYIYSSMLLYYVSLKWFFMSNYFHLKYNL